MKWHRITFFVVLVFALVQPLFAFWVGEGEVMGEVIESQSVNNKAVFRLTISNQTVKGTKLGSPNTFSFNGLNWKEITKGDIVKLQVKSSDNYGILVEQMEFIENKPGTIKQLHSIWWIVLIFVAFISAIIFLLFRRHNRKG